MPADQPSANRPSFVADSLATGMLIMLVMTVIQRALGFFRGIWFCRLLDDTVVGQWSMAYDFIIMITPIMLLGMPGTLPRYVEHFRNQGHLSQFLRRILTATVFLGVLFIALLMLLPDWFGWLVFLEPQSTSLIYGVGVGVIAIIAYNFVYQLVASLRQVSVASWMQFVQGIGFTVFGIAWLTLGGGIIGLVLAFVVATILAIVPGALALARGWRGLPSSPNEFEAPKMWRRIVPFALALWAMNLLTNIFAMSDRLMILHWIPGGQGQAAVGQYHSSRIFAVLLMSVATMIAGVLLPYLTADWESGNREKTRQTLRKILFAVGTTFTAGGAVSLLISPWLFSVLLEDRYFDGLNLMPMAFVFSIWVAIFMIGQNYLWVAECGKLVAAAVSVGLVINIALNAWLMPMWGLHGAVVATMVANGVVLIGLWIAMAGQGFKLDETCFYVTVLPLTLLAGPLWALVFTMIIVAVNEQSLAWIQECCLRLSTFLRVKGEIAK